MNFESWNVDLDTASAVHASGFKITVEGDPCNPTGVHPGKFPDGLTAVQQARLLRCGLEAMQKLASTAGIQRPRVRVQEPVRKHKPTRPILSLKKKA